MSEMVFGVVARSYLNVPSLLLAERNSIKAFNVLRTCGRFSRTPIFDTIYNKSDLLLQEKNLIFFITTQNWVKFCYDLCLLIRQNTHRKFHVTFAFRWLVHQGYQGTLWCCLCSINFDVLDQYFNDHETSIWVNEFVKALINTSVKKI